MTTTDVVTIGAGFFAELHIEAWSRNPDATLTGIVDQNIGKAEQLRDKHAPEAKVFASASDALAELEPNIVDIATPPPTHAAMIALADELSPKAIICQKPFCGDLTAAQAVSERTKSLLIVHENFRFQPWYRAIKPRLTNGTLGDLYQITFRLRPGDGQGPDAYLERQPYFQEMERFLVHETAIHWIDTFRYLMGEPVAVYAALRKLNPAIQGEDAGIIVFDYANGARAVFDGNRLADHAADNTRLTMGECLIEGSKGTLTLDGYGRIFLRSFGAQDEEQIQPDYDVERFGGDCVYAFQKHVTDHLAHGTSVENTAKAYLRNQEIEEAIYRSASDGRKISL